MAKKDNTHRRKELEAALGNRVCYDLLEGFAIDEFNAENIQFLNAVRAVWPAKGHAPDRSPWPWYCLTDTSRSEWIYKHFVRDGAPKQVNLPYTVRNELDQAAEHDRLNFYSFGKAYEEIIDLVLANWFRRFWKGLRPSNRDYLEAVAETSDFDDE